MMFCTCECLCMSYLLESGEVKIFEFCISGWNRMLQTYIESATTLSDQKNYYPNQPHKITTVKIYGVENRLKRDF